VRSLILSAVALSLASAPLAAQLKRASEPTQKESELVGLGVVPILLGVAAVTAGIIIAVDDDDDDDSVS